MTAPDNAPPKALEGIRVLDFTWVRAGPWATRWLGMLGAEIIKVEWPLNERGRTSGAPPKGIEPGLNSSPTFNDTNPNKLGVTLNMRSEKGLALVKRLVAECDVVVENFSPKALKSWGLGFDVLSEINPGIVYVSQSGFGHTGRNSAFTSLGPTAQAFSGMTHLSGLPGRQPCGWGWSYLDDTGGMYIAHAILAGLHHRNQTGEGQHIDLAQMIVGVTLNGSAMLDATINGRGSRREGFPAGNRSHWPGTPLLNNYRGATTAPHNAYKTKGGGYNDWCAIACYGDDEWQKLIEVMGSPAWAADAKFGTLAGRLEHQEELDDGIAAWAAALDKYAIMETCQTAGVRAMPVQSTEDRVINDPQLQHRGYLTEMDHPVLGKRGFQNAPFKLSETPPEHTRSSPLIGQHLREVMEGLLGLSHGEVLEGIEDGTFWPKTLAQPPYFSDIIKGGALDDSIVPKPKSDRPSPKAAAEKDAGPYAGLRVLEISGEAGQFCGKLFGDLGADVIKIEAPGGDVTRAIGPFLNDEPDRERSLAFWHYNTSKRGVTLNLETSDGRALFKKLAATADVILETEAPGRLDDLGIGYNALKAENPGLIYCALTPFGQTGPWRDYQASDMLHLAAGGFMGCCGYNTPEDDADETPIAPGGNSAWHTASHYAYMGILAALAYRDRTGRGQFVDASVHEACAVTTELHVPTYLYHDKVVIRQTGRHCSLDPTPFGQWQCKDGWYVNAQPDRIPAKSLPALVEWMAEYDAAGDLGDEKYKDPKVFTESRAHLDELLKNFATKITAQEMANGGQQRGINWGVVQAPEDLTKDPHLADRGFWHQVEHPELGRTFTYPGPAGLCAKTPWKISRRAPLIGEHNKEVYGEELGLNENDLTMLSGAGVI